MSSSSNIAFGGAGARDVVRIALYSGVSSAVEAGADRVPRAGGVRGSAAGGDAELLPCVPDWAFTVCDAAEGVGEVGRVCGGDPLLSGHHRDQWPVPPVRGALTDGTLAHPRCA